MSDINAADTADLQEAISGIAVRITLDLADHETNFIHVRRQQETGPRFRAAAALHADQAADPVNPNLINQRLPAFFDQGRDLIFIAGRPRRFN